MRIMVLPLTIFLYPEYVFTHATVVHTVQKPFLLPQHVFDQHILMVTSIFDLFDLDCVLR